MGVLREECVSGGGDGGVEGGVCQGKGCLLTRMCVAEVHSLLSAVIMLVTLPLPSPPSPFFPPLPFPPPFPLPSPPLPSPPLPLFPSPSPSPPLPSLLSPPLPSPPLPLPSPPHPLQASCNPVAYSLLADFFPPNHRAVALSVYHFGVYLGGSIGYLCGAINSALDWRWTFRILGITGLAAVPVALATAWEPKSVREKRRRRKAKKKEITIMVSAEGSTNQD